MVMKRGDFQEQSGVMRGRRCSKLLELAATDDLAGFIVEVEERGCNVDELSCWYLRNNGSRKMGFEERTPLMIASLYGSIKVVEYILGTGVVDVNRACGSDGATALHCAAAGCSGSSVEVVKLLIGASADITCADACGNKPSDLIAPYVKSSANFTRKTLELLLKGLDGEAATKEIEKEEKAKESNEKKDYPMDVSLPDINVGLYATDEFRMYSFKVKPCSRAYSHDWTECPFVHPGENARRRDPHKFQYTCVPCPEFKKGTCAKGDSCEYAHGVFESWLHPSQYRTRICKDETACARKVCFFAHRAEELRPLCPSTGSAMPSPKSGPASSMDVGTLSSLALGSSSSLMPRTSTPPLSPVTTCSSPMSTSMWQNKVKRTPPSLQLQGSRLKTALSARDLNLEMELLGLENIHAQQQRQQLIDEMASLSSPSRWSNLDNAFGSRDASFMPQSHGLSPRMAPSNTAGVQSPPGHQVHQNMNHLRAPPVSKPSTYGFDSSAAVAAALMSSRSAAYAKRSQSFIDRSHSATSPSLRSSNLSDWSSPDGKLEWGFNGEDRHRLQKSASFGFRNGNIVSRNTAMAPSTTKEPDVSWVHSLVKDVPPTGAGLCNPEQKRNPIFPWLDQLYIEQEQIMA